MSKEQQKTIRNVEHPKYYNSHPSGIECVQVIQKRDFNMGCVIKYIWRHGLKKEMGLDLNTKTIEDLSKAIVYLKFESKYLQDIIDGKVKGVEVHKITPFRKFIKSIISYHTKDKDLYYKNLILPTYSGYIALALDTIWDIGLNLESDLLNMDDTQRKIKYGITFLESAIVEIERNEKYK